MSNNYQLLKNLVYNGAIKKNIVVTDRFLDRINYELSVIEKLGFTDYFILYSRIIEICNELKLIRSYGRGSAANSLVNYCLDITKINSIEENLIFERFIQPNQKQQPDIDIDVPKGYQKQIIEKLKQNHPEYNAYFIAFSPKIETVYKGVLYNNITYKKHPCGFVITSKKLNNNTFSYNDQEFYLATDIENDTFYENKIDILQLEYLNRLQLIVNEIGEEYHPYNLPLDDKKVFDLFSSGDLDNVFQCNTEYHKRIFNGFKPNSIHDLCIINALFRPKLTEFIPKIIEKKNNPVKSIFQNDTRVSEILKESYGMLIYQETFLHLSKEIAGISYEEANLWRRKILLGGNTTDVIQLSNLFANGCKEFSTLNNSEILNLTKMVSEMAGVTFQKAHSLSYATIGYWGAFYRTHFRTQFNKAFNYDLKFELL